jgi:hypothetical protein
MKIGYTSPKIPWKSRLLWAAGSGLLYTFLLWMLGYLWHDFDYTPAALLFQGVFFGLFFGLAFPYLFFRFGKYFAHKVEKPSIPTLNMENPSKWRVMPTFFGEKKLWVVSSSSHPQK